MLSQLETQVCNLPFLSSHSVLFYFISLSSTPTSMLRYCLYFRSAGNLYIWNKTFIITIVWSLLFTLLHFGTQCGASVLHKHNITEASTNSEEKSSTVGEPIHWVKFDLLASGNCMKSRPTGSPFICLLEWTVVMEGKVSSIQLRLILTRLNMSFVWMTQGYFLSHSCSTGVTVVLENRFPAVLV